MLLEVIWLKLMLLEMIWLNLMLLDLAIVDAALDNVALGQNIRKDVIAAATDTGESSCQQAQ